MFQPASLSDIPAFGIGHAENIETATGCTVIVAPQGATCGVDVRGGGPATRETDLLKPENMIEKVHAIVLSGGSAFGLEASSGVMSVLAEHGIGFPVGSIRVPIVTGACLFDLLVGAAAYPDKAMGRAAAEAALLNLPHTSQQSTENTAVTSSSASEPTTTQTTPPPLGQGNVGAGCGATVGKLIGIDHAMKAGFGYACLRFDNVVVATLVAVNALGCIRATNGTWIAGCHDKAGHILDPLAAFAVSMQTSENSSEPETICENTTIGVVLTNAKLTKAQATKVSSTVHDAYARSIKPVHTSNDGDTIFTFASGETEASPDTVAFLATETMQYAIESAIVHACGMPGLPSYKDLVRISQADNKEDQTE